MVMDVAAPLLDLASAPFGGSAKEFAGQAKMPVHELHLWRRIIEGQVNPGGQQGSRFAARASGFAKEIEQFCPLFRRDLSVCVNALQPCRDLLGWEPRGDSRVRLNPPIQVMHLALDDNAVFDQLPADAQKFVQLLFGHA